MFVYHQFDPVALHIGPLAIRWYGLMYLLSFVTGGFLLWIRGKSREPFFNSEQIIDLVFYAALGVMLGGRIGYMFFYGFSKLMVNPLSLFKVWDGGMSFHGGLIGVLISMWLYSRKVKLAFLDLMDFIAPVVPIGLGAGRFGNFINGELWGRVTEVPWGMVYPQAGLLPRHPSELYELFLEGVVLFIILWLFSSKKRPTGAVSGLFALGYGIFRIACEFFREPDQQLGFLAWDWVTMGQVLSFPLIFVGIALLVTAYRRRIA